MKRVTLALSCILLMGAKASADREVAKGMAPRMETQQIVGVVDPLGPAGLGEDNDLWTLAVSLRPWRNADGTLVPEGIYLTRGRLPPAELDRLSASLPEWGIVRLRLAGEPHRRRDDSGRERWEGEFVEVLDGAVADADLAAWVEQRRQPVLIDDPYFGTLELDRRLNAYDGRRHLATGSYKLSIERPTKDDDNARDQALIAGARSSFERLERELPRYFAGAADKLLDLYNKNWREDGLPALRREEFIQRLKVASVRLDGSGAMNVYLDPGELFAGHWIEIRVGAGGEVRQIALAG